MGQETIMAVEREKDFELCAKTDVGDDLRKIIEQTLADVVVDFTEPSCVFENAKIILESRARGVIGTTGLLPEQIQTLSMECEKKNKGMIIAPNFSIGALLLMKLSQFAARYMPDVEIIELHHPAKKDAPSGTAVKTAELIAENQGAPTVPRGTSGDSSLGEIHSGIPVHSVRLPGLLAHEEVIFGGEGQILTIRHDSFNRSSFMPGVVMAIRKSMELTTLVYGLDQILFEVE